MDHSTERSCAIVCGTSIASIERSLISNDLCRCSTSASLACCTSSCERRRERSIGLADAEPFFVLSLSVKRCARIGSLAL